MPVTPTGPDPRRWRALAVLALVQLVLILDATAVNVALPSLRRGLGFSESGLAWVVNGYALTFGGLLLLGGRLADIAGRRRVFLAGLALFTFASATAGLAGSPATLVASRLAQGAGAAFAGPAALSLVALLFTDPRERVRALSLWGGIGAFGGMLGVVLSGVLSELASWRWVFLINLPVAAAVFVLAPRLIPAGRERGGGRLDLPGAVLVTAAVSLIVFALLGKGDTAWTSPALLGRLGAGVLVLTVFALWQARAPHPLAPLRFFRSRTRATAYLAGGVILATIITMFFLMTLYMQQVLGYSSMRTGFAYVPFGLTVLAGVAATRRLIPRFGVRRVMTTGLLLAATGILLLSGVPTGGHYATDLLPGLLVLPLGTSSVIVSSTVAAVHSITPAETGLASGVLTAAQQIGAAIGVSAFASLALARSHELAVTGATPAAAATSGYNLALGVLAAVLALTAIVAFLGLRTRNTLAARRRLARYRAALDAGADPAVVTQWINEAQRDKQAAQKKLDEGPAVPRKMAITARCATDPADH
ncbi:MFS transporter [Streptomyces sp. NPDC058964]|uniref:MFS transporter n=1 Tax=Streptomyces sp. NPDC058964 TaxID=3346681 RepID=UPI0036806958